MALLASAGIQAQVIAYDVQTTTTAYEDVSGGTVIDLQGNVGTDLSKVLFDNDGNVNYNDADDVTAFPIGFDFGYDGKVMKYFVLTGDGAVLLSTEETISTDVHTTSTPANSLTTQNSKNMFGAMTREGHYGLDDTEISYKLEGADGSHVLVIQYKNIGLQSNSYSVETEMAKAQIQYRLYEATGNIEMKVSGFKPYDGVATGNYNWMRIGIVGDPGDFLFLNKFDANGSESLSQNSASVDYTAESYPADGTTWTFVAPEPCVTPAVAPTALTLSSTTSQLSGSFTAGDADRYLVVVALSNNLGALPADKTKYAAGDVIGDGQVLAIVEKDQPIETPAGFEFEPATEYFVFVFGFNSLCSAGPLYNATPATASIVTKPAGPAAIATDNVGLNSFTVNVTSNGTSPVLVAITSEQGTDRWGDYLEGGVFGDPTGSYAVGDEIEGGGKVVFAGTPSGAFEVNGLVAGRPYYLRAWSSDGNGGYSSEYVETIAVTVGVLPWTAAMDEKIGYNAILPGWTKSDPDEWSSQPGEYIYSNVTFIEDEEQGSTSWIETPFIQLGEAGTKLKVAVGGSARVGWSQSDWTLGDNDKIVFQLTKDGEQYVDVLTIDKNNAATLSRSERTAFSAVFDELAGETVRLRILVQRFSQGQAHIGQITLEEKSDCEAPVDLHLAGLDGSDATLAWTQQAEEGSWEVSYKKAADDEWSEPLLTNEPQVVITDLQGATNYQVRVRSLCSETSVSSWSEAFAFKTGYTVPFVTDLATADLSDWGAYAGILSEDTELFEGGDVIISTRWGGGYNHVYHPNVESYSWLVTPSIALGSNADANYEVTFTFTTEWAIVGGDNFSIKAVVAKDGENFSSNNVIGTIELADMPAEGEQGTYAFNFSGFTGNVRIGFYFAGQASELPWLILDSVGMQGGVTTAISDVRTASADQKAVYNLNGQRVNGLQKGLLIIDGRKVMVK